MTILHRSMPKQQTIRVVGVHQGSRPGPTLICIGAVHGNEPAGVLAAQRVLDKLASHPPQSFTGKMVALIGNISAYQDHDPDVRYHQQDLNRLCTRENAMLVRDADPETLTGELLELKQLLATLEAEFAAADGPVFLLDMHTVSSASPPFVAIEDSLPARRFVSKLPIPVILGFEEEIPGLLIDLVTNHYGHVCALVETGEHDDPAAVDGHEAALWLMLHTAGILDVSKAPHQNDPFQFLKKAAARCAGQIYDVRHREAVTSEGYHTQSEIHAFDPVHQNHTVLAMQDGQPVRAAMTGLVFMPNRQTRAREGDDAFFIIRRVGRVWLAASVFFRNIPAVHAALPKLVPGVRKCPDQPDCLLVSPRVAAVFKREVFHLLGYRIIRHGKDTHLPMYRRIAHGFAGLGASLWMIIAGLFKGGEKALLARQMPDDWVVRRHKLDHT